MRPFKFFFGITLAVLFFFFVAKFVVMAFFIAALLSIAFFFVRKLKSFLYRMDWEEGYHGRPYLQAERDDQMMPNWRHAPSFEFSPRPQSNDNGARIIEIF